MTDWLVTTETKNPRRAARRSRGRLVQFALRLGNLTIQRLDVPVEVISAKSEYGSESRADGDLRFGVGADRGQGPARADPVEDQRKVVDVALARPEVRAGVSNVEAP